MITLLKTNATIMTSPENVMKYVFQNILCTRSLAPPTSIFHKMRKINYTFLHLLHMLKTCILASQSCKIFLSSHIVLRVRQLNSKGGTSENHTFDADDRGLFVSWCVQLYRSLLTWNWSSVFCKRFCDPIFTYVLLVGH